MSDNDDKPPQWPCPMCNATGERFGTECDVCDGEGENSAGLFFK